MLYLVRRGTISIRMRKGAAFVEIGRIYANEVIGELTFFDRAPRSAAAMALTEVEVLEIEFDAMERVFQSIPDYMRAIMASMADRLRKSNESIRRLERHTVNELHNIGRNEDGDSAADVLAATADILGSAGVPPLGESAESGAEGEFVEGEEEIPGAPKKKK